MRKELWFLIALIAVSLFLAFLQSKSSWSVQEILYGNEDYIDEYKKLEIENKALRAELALLQDLANQIPVPRAEYVTASIYSRYPLTTKNELLVNVGDLHGVKAGQVAVVPARASSVGGEGLLVGKVKKVFEASAIIETIFDPNWKSAVRIGNAGTEALLIGGYGPKLTLIDKKAKLKIGDAVYSVASNLAFGMAVGRIATFELGADGLFKEATLDFGYELRDIQHILISKSEILL